MALKEALNIRNPKLWVPASCFLAFLILSRVLDLASKPYHHDESLYAIEAWRYATSGQYSFNPMLHGPFLFHFHAALFQLLPINDTTGRLPVVIFGILFPIMGALLLRNRSVSTVVTWIAFCALSPVFCYFSRFLGMDLPMIFLSLSFVTMLSYLLETGQPKFIYLSALAFVFMVCTKLNFLFPLFAIFTFLGAWWALKFVEGEPIHKDHIQLVKEFVKNNWLHLAYAAGLIVLVFTALYSSMGRNPKGILDALGVPIPGRENLNMFKYWANQHKMQRIKGPFQYYIPILLIYELPAVIAILWAGYRCSKSSKFFRAFSARIVGAALLIWGICHFNWTTVGPFLSSTFHFDTPWHASLCLLEVALGFILVKYHLDRDEKLEAFSAHWGIVSLLLYSYAGEKIPWLTTHILLPWLLYIAMVFPGRILELIEKPVRRYVIGAVLILAVGWQAVITIRSSHMLSAHPSERLVYTHTSWDVVHLVNKFYKLADFTNQKKDLKVQVIGEAAWPLYWYLRDYKRWFYTELTPADQPIAVVVDWEKREQYRSQLPEYEMEQVKLREWWLYETQNASFGDLINYYFTRKPFSELGHQDLAVFVDKKYLPTWRQLTFEESRTSTP